MIVPTSSQVEQGLIREFIQALADEIASIKRGRGGSIVTVTSDGRRRDVPGGV